MFAFFSPYDGNVDETVRVWVDGNVHSVRTWTRLDSLRWMRLRKGRPKSAQWISIMSPDCSRTPA